MHLQLRDASVPVDVNYIGIGGKKHIFEVGGGITVLAVGAGASGLGVESSANESATFECALDSASYAPCTSPLTYTNLLDGMHAFHVRGTDRAGWWTHAR